MKYFTRLTVVQPLTRIRRERLLPQNGEVVVRVGQDVSPMQVVARTALETDFYVVPASERLGVTPEELPQYLLVDEGTVVNQGMVLAERKQLLRRKTVTSPVDGVVADLSGGRIILKQTLDWLELRAMLKGRVVSSISVDRGVVVETSGSLIQAVWGSGQEGYGIIKMVSETADAALSIDQLNGDIAGRILVAGRVDEPDVLARAEENGVHGLIAGSMPASICQLATSLSFPVILTDEIGTHPMAQPIFQLLQKSEDREASLFGQQQDHWGNRPEIVIPLEAGPGLEAPPLNKPIAVGQTARILRQPYTSQVGQIIRVYRHAQTTPIQTRAHGADVRLTDGRVVYVPNANFDIIS